MASIRKLPNGSYQATVSLGRGADGRQIRKYVTKDTLKECKSAARKIEEDYENGKTSNYSDMKFSTWAAKFIELKRPPEISPTTHRFYKECINLHFIPYFGQKKLGQITDIHIREYIASKRKENSFKTGKPLSETTIKKHFVILSHMLGMALKMQNPCLEVKAPDSNYKPRYVPTTEEFDRLLNAVGGLWDELPILLAGWCGMREGEIFCLKVNDIAGNKITVDENRALAEVEDGDTKYEYIEKGPKSENGKRVVAVPAYVADLVQNRILQLELKDDDFLFDMRPDSYGKRFTKIIKYHNLMLTDAPTGKKASFAKETLPRQLHIQDKLIPEFTFHALRHYHATVLYEEHYPDLYAAKRLGHDISVLKGIYQRLGLKQKESFDEKINDTFKKPE